MLIDHPTSAVAVAPQVQLVDVLSALTWSEPWPVGVEWRARYDQLIAARVAAAADAELVIGECLAGLPDWAVRRVQLEPVVLRQLTSGQPDPMGAARALMVVLERMARGAMTAAPERIEIAGRPGGDLAVLYDASLDLPARPGLDADLRGVPPELVPEARRRLQDGVALLRALSPPAADFAPRFIDLLCLREEDAAPCYSGSFETLPGLVYASNIHVASAFKMVDVLVHEAVHGALYVFETIREPLLAVRCDARLTSPWTGIPLRAAAYVQACFVWHALAGFWLRAIERTGDPRCAPFLRRAALGFGRAPVTGEYRELLSRHASREVLACLVEIERRMQGPGWAGLIP